MEKHPCKVKLHQNKIVCASEILCDDCMSHDGHKREKGKLKQKRWEK